MVLRALGTAVVFGAIGGAVLGAWLVAALGEGDGPAPFMSVWGAIWGLAVGAAFAVVPLVVGAVAGDATARRRPALCRPVGALATGVVLLAEFAGWTLYAGADIGEIASGLTLGVAAYATAVAWLRLPWIYAGGRPDTLTA